jgi:cyclophilin family peptidyl-prolyl cis-trans isomerase
MGLPISQKDTGGSQFFICLSPQPHLDGNYTAFGQVVKGIEILSDLSEGDSILEINLSLKDNTKPKYRQL